MRWSHRCRSMNHPQPELRDPLVWHRDLSYVSCRKSREWHRELLNPAVSVFVVMEEGRNCGILKQHVVRQRHSVKWSIKCREKKKGASTCSSTSLSVSSSSSSSPPGVPVPFAPFFAVFFLRFSGPTFGKVVKGPPAGPAFFLLLLLPPSDTDSSDSSSSS